METAVTQPNPEHIALREILAALANKLVEKGVITKTDWVDLCLDADEEARRLGGDEAADIVMAFMKTG